MNADPQIETLLYPLRSEMIGDAEGWQNILCIGLSEPLTIEELISAKLTYAQGFRPDFLKLQRAGCYVVPELPKRGGYDAVLVRLGRHRGQNEAWLAEARKLVKKDGLILASGGKTDGAVSLRKRIAKAGMAIDYASLNHGVVFWFDAAGAAALSDLAPTSATPVEGRFVTAPGMFSHGKIDSGSRLLAQHLPDSLSGVVADFCAGWGYLSSRIAEQCPGVETLHLYEADHASLQAAKTNLQALNSVKVEFFWHDLFGEPLDQHYDAIVMNPPFHTGRKAEPELGIRLIEVAHDALRDRGHLLLVANRQLPYETTLKSQFGSVNTVVEDAHYKVLIAVR